MSISSSSPIVCSGSSTTLTANGANNYSWSTNELTTSISVSPSIITNYTVVGTDGNGCSNSGSITITVNDNPIVGINSSDADNTLCVGDMLTLSGTGANTYTWDNAVIDGVGFTPTSITYNVLGTDVNGCSNSANISIIVNNLPIVDINSSDADNTLCAGEMLTLNGTGADSYVWDNGVDNGVDFTPASTTYNIIGTDANGCSNTASIMITVNSSVAPIITENAGTLTADQSNVQWYGVNQGLIAGANSPVYAALMTDTYYCVNTSSVCTSDTSNNIFVLIDGIAKLENTIGIYPNPNKGQFTVELSNEAFVTIHNSIGQIIYSAQLNSGKTKVDLSNKEVAEGIYTVKISNSNGSTQVKKLVIR